MQAFLKALRYCWPYRYRILAGWLCGWLSAVLWAGSFSAVLPMFDLLFGQPSSAVRYVASGPSAVPAHSTALSHPHSHPARMR